MTPTAQTLCQLAFWNSRITTNAIASIPGNSQWRSVRRCTFESFGRSSEYAVKTAKCRWIEDRPRLR